MTPPSASHAPFHIAADKSAMDQAPAPPVCRICHTASTPTHKLLTPCACTGTCAHIHSSCAEQWIARRIQTGIPLHQASICEICRTPYAHALHAPHPISFMLSAGAWRRWAHVAYMAFVGRRMRYELALVFRLLRGGLGLTVAYAHTTDRKCGRDVVSRVSFSLLMATHYALFLFLDARHLMSQYRKWRASTARIVVRDKHSADAAEASAE